MIVAITGANGFIGRHLCERFARSGWDVRPVTRRDFHARPIAQLFANADAVVHAAGATRAPPPAAARLLESNTELTRRVVHAAVDAGVGRLVFISSQAAVGPARSLDDPVDEGTGSPPIEAYGRSKHLAEAIVNNAGGSLSHVIVRPSAVYGPGDRDFLNLFRLARLRVALHAANREHWTSIIHVADLADGILAAATVPEAAGKTFFLSNDAAVQWSGLFQAAARSARVPLVLDLDVPRPFITLGAAIGDVIGRVTNEAPLLSSEKAALARPRYWVCSNARAKQVLGFQPRIELQEGFDETYRWYRDNGWL